MDGDSGVTHDGFRAGGGDLDIFARFLDDLVANSVKVAFLGLHDDLLVRKGSEAGWAPVAHATTAVDKAVFVKLEKGGQDSL